MTISNLSTMYLLGVVLLASAALCTAQFTDEEIEEIVRAHNSYRGRVDPIATNMEQLEWNEELGYMAQFWAGNCEYELNENRNSQSNTFTYVGQSMIATSSYSVNYTVLIGKWFSAGQYYNYYSGYCTDSDGDEDEDGDSCAGYTQLVSASTYAVGCGAYRCDELRGGDDYDEEAALFFVCNYGPSGNQYDSPYQTGSDSCSACPSDKPFCVSNLCADSGSTPSVQLPFFGILSLGLVSMALW